MATHFLKTTRSLSGDSPIFSILTWVIALIILSVWLYWFIYSEIEIFEVSTKAKLQVEKSPHTLAAMLPSKIISTKLSIGQIVNAGDVLVELDAGTQKLLLQEEESRLAAMPSKISSLSKELVSLQNAKVQAQKAAGSAIQEAKLRREQEKASESFAKENAKRLKTESQYGSVAKVEALRAEADARKLSASSDALLAESQKIESDSRMIMEQNDAKIEYAKRELENVESDFQAKKITVSRLREDIDRFTLRAPISGRIGDVMPFKVGSYVTEGEKLATIIPNGGVIVVADFEPAAVLGRIKVGQMSQMRLEGFPWMQYGTIKARVNKVSTEVRDNLVRVELTPIEEAKTKNLLQHGLPGVVEVHIEKVHPYILVLRTVGQKTTFSKSNQKNNLLHSTNDTQ